MPSQWVSIPCYIVRPAIVRIQDALGIKVKVTSVFPQTGLRIKHREESLSLCLCPCLDMFVMLMMIQTHLGHLGILLGHVLNNTYLGRLIVQSRRLCACVRTTHRHHRASPYGTTVSILRGGKIGSLHNPRAAQVINW